MAWHLLERPSPNIKPKQKDTTGATRLFMASKTKAWYVIEGDSGRRIAAFVDAKGSCSCRLYALDTGRFVRKSRADGSFGAVFAALMREGFEFRPPYRLIWLRRKSRVCRARLCAPRKWQVNASHPQTDDQKVPRPRMIADDQQRMPSRAARM